MKILTKYVLREHVGPLMFALSALTSLLLLNYIAKNLSLLVGKGLPWTVVAEFLLLSVPFTVAMTLPMAVLVAVLYAFSRLASENEIAAMKANGVAMGSLMIPIAIGSLFFAGIMVGFNDQILPRANHRLATLIQDIKRKKPTFALRERVLNDVVTGLSLRTDAIDRTDNVLRNVHIYDITDPKAVRTIHADSGRIALTADQKDLLLRLYEGYVVEVNKQQLTEINRIYFTENEIRVRGVGNELQRDSLNLYKGERERTICDMQQQYSTAREELYHARHEYRQQMVYLVRRAVNGEDADFPAKEAPPVPRETSWGSVYCKGVSLAAQYLPVKESMTDSGGDTAAGVELSTGEPVQPPADPPAPGDSAQPQKNDSTTMTQATTAGADSGGKAAARASSARPSSLAFTRFRSASDGLGGELESIRARIQQSEYQMRVNEVEIHKKFALAGACVVFVLIGVPFALRFPRGGVGLVIGASLAIFAVSYVGLIAGESLAKRGSLSPFLAMWGANFLLLLVGVALLTQMGRESMSRGGTLSAWLEESREFIARVLRRRAAA